jgi:hypothetical protein
MRYLMRNLGLNERSQVLKIELPTIIVQRYCYKNGGLLISKLPCDRDIQQHIRQLRLSRSIAQNVHAVVLDLLCSCAQRIHTRAALGALG